MSLRRPTKPLEEELFDAPHVFDFLAAMRLLEALAPGARPLAEGEYPEQEGVTFKARARLDFAPGEIDRIEWQDPRHLKAAVFTNFFGLAQINGPLPYSFAETLIDRAFRHDYAGVDFLDLFHHRLTSILFRAKKKYRPALTQRPPDAGRMGRTLRSLTGIGTRGLEDRLALPDRSLLSLTGLFLGTKRTQIGLEQAITHHFGCGAEILPFRGRFKKLEKHQVSRLGRQNSVLRGSSDNAGDGVVLGDRVYIADAGFELRYGPIDDGELERLLPGSERFEALASLVKFYTEHQYEIAIRVRIETGSPRRSRLTSKVSKPGVATPAEEESRPARLGWNSWLITRPTSQEDDQVVLRPGASQVTSNLAGKVPPAGREEAPPQPFRLDLGNALDDE